MGGFFEWRSSSGRSYKAGHWANTARAGWILLGEMRIAQPAVIFRMARFCDLRRACEIALQCHWQKSKTLWQNVFERNPQN